MERVKKTTEISSLSKFHIIYGSIIMILCLSFIITVFTMKSQITELKKNTIVAQVPGGNQQVNADSITQTPEAKKMLEEYGVALLKNPGDTQALTGMGNLFFDSGRYEKAIEYYEKSQGIDAKNSGLTSDLATCYFYTNKHDKAIKTFKLAIELDPQNINARYNLGIVYKTIGKLPEAKKEWEEMKNYINTEEEKAKYKQLLDNLTRS